MRIKDAISGRLSQLANVRLPAKGEAVARVEKISLYALILLAAYASADLAILNFRDLMLPNQAPPASPFRDDSFQSQARVDYNSIINRNPFSSDGVIPDPLGVTKGGSPDDIPVPTALPVQLVGTMVHSDQRRSVATLSLSSGSKVISYRVGETIDGIGKVEKIERKKVFFRNRNAYDRMEYAEIKSKGPTMFGLSRPQVSAEPIEVNGNNVVVKRAEVNKQLNNLPELLNQASTVPNFVPGSGGKINGFRIVNMQPGSVFEKFGLKRFDVIKSVNGETVDSPSKAMEMYNQLKSSSQIAIIVERDGSDQTLNFSIAE